VSLPTSLLPLTAKINLEHKVNRQAEAMKSQQIRIRDLTGRVIRLETQLELLTSAALAWQLKNDPSPDTR